MNTLVANETAKIEAEHKHTLQKVNAVYSRILVPLSDEHLINVGEANLNPGVHQDFEVQQEIYQQTVAETAREKVMLREEIGNMTSELRRLRLETERVREENQRIEYVVGREKAVREHKY